MHKGGDQEQGSPARKCKLHQKKFLAPHSSLTKSLASSRLQATGKNNFVQFIAVSMVSAIATCALQQLCQLLNHAIHARQSYENMFWNKTSQPRKRANLRKRSNRSYIYKQAVAECKTCWWWKNNRKYIYDIYPSRQTTSKSNCNQGLLSPN